MHNEAANAEPFLRALHHLTLTLFKDVLMVVVDDGSADSTADTISRMIDAGLPIHFLRLSRNFGKELALTAGLDAIERLTDPVDAVLIIDADFQHPLETVRAMTRRWEQGVDMIYGVQERANEGWLRRGFTWIFYRLMRFAQQNIDIPPDAGDFRLMDRRVVTAINRLPEANRYMKGLYAWVGFGAEGIRFQSAKRREGTSSFNFRRLAALALDGLVAFTSWPLRLASVIGLLVSLLAFAFGGWIIVERLWIGQPIPGFATLAAAITLLAGIQLLSIGLLGEYISRIFLEVKRRPLYILAEERSPLPRAMSEDGNRQREEDSPGRDDNA